MLLPTLSTMTFKLVKLRLSSEVELIPISAPRPQSFVVVVTLMRSHIKRGAKLNTAVLTKPDTSFIGTRNPGRKRMAAFETLPA